MKVLVFDRCSADVFDENAIAEIIPDSAIIKDGKPFFIPDDAKRWKYSCGVAVRICRLGKNISEKFASRYIDAYAPCITTFPADSKGFNALNRCHEGAVIIGEWGMSEAQGCAGFKFSTSSGENATVTIDTDIVTEMVALAGQKGVMKIGDIIVMNEDYLAENLAIDTRITAIDTVNGETRLSFSVK